MIHTPTMSSPAMHVDGESVALAMKGALECAQRLKIRSIAIPGLGTGVGGVPMRTAAAIMMQHLKDHVEKFDLLRFVIFVGYQDMATKEFAIALQKIFKMSGR
ncbi:MAG: macro domain-containing protein [Candidatus Bathyarchaeota archaeon]|nr:MAG: macro domain-containing protein [Candidatus Bathyarchaeota archaeon]